MNSQLADAVTAATARALAQIQRDATRAEELRAAEHRAFMAEEREKLAEALRKVEARLAEDRVGIDGHDGIGVAGAMLSHEGHLIITLSDGETRDIGNVMGRDGIDADMEALRAHLDDWIKSVQLPKDGRDGIDVDMESVLRRVDDYLKAIRIPEDGKDGRDGTDGADVNMELVIHRVDDYLTGIKIPKDGEPGRDGADADMEALTNLVTEYLRGIPAPKDGKDGKDGERGADAYPGEAKGLYSPDETYRSLDCVSWNGSEWRAKKDSPGALPGPDWMLSASKGKRGERGEKGQRGPSGNDGKNGVSPVGATLDAEQMVLTFVMDDGSTFDVDFLPVAEAIKRHLQG
jgi:hypothetical protein